ncbi:MAG: inositol monophosphatase family protein, partial [Pseudomonadales bacterium]
MEPAVNIALRAARKAGDMIAKAAERMDLVKIEEKEKNDFVSNVDHESEREILAQLKRAWPDDNFYGEESGFQQGQKGESDTTWYIDPLDGTTNFLRGIPHYAISIGCVKKGMLEHAVVYDPIRREEFIASRGKGASLNGRRIRVSEQKEFDGALIGTGIPYRASQQPFISGYMTCVEHFANSNSGIRRAGSAALDLAYV